MIRVFVVFRIFGVFIEYFIFSDNEEIIEFVIDKEIGIVIVVRNRILDREK